MKLPYIFSILLIVALLSSSVFVFHFDSMNSEDSGLLSGKSDLEHIILTPNPNDLRATLPYEPLDTTECSTFLIPRPYQEPSDIMLEELVGLSSLYSDEALAFENSDFIDQIAESLFFYNEDSLFGLAKLELALSQVDPNRMNEAIEMLDYALSTDDETNVNMYRLFFRTWGEVDAPSAIKYAMEVLPENIIRLDAGVEAMLSWAKQDPGASADMITNLPDTYGKDYLIFALPYVYIESDPEAAILWARGLSSQYSKNTLLHSMIKWLDHDPDAAVNYVIEFAQIEGNIDYNSKVLISEAMTYVVRHDVNQAFEFSEAFSGEAKTEAMVALIDWWADASPEKASEWMTHLESSIETDKIIDRFSEVTTRIDPEGAAAWASTISTESIRNEALSKVLLMWLQLDLDQAEAWAQANGFVNLLPAEYEIEGVDFNEF